MVLHSNLDMGIYLIIEEKINKSPSQIMFTVIEHWFELENLLQRWSETGF